MKRLSVFFLAIGLISLFSAGCRKQQFNDQETRIRVSSDLWDDVQFEYASIRLEDRDGTDFSLIMNDGVDYEEPYFVLNWYQKAVILEMPAMEVLTHQAISNLKLHPTVVHHYAHLMRVAL